MSQPCPSLPPGARGGDVPGSEGRWCCAQSHPQCLASSDLLLEEARFPWENPPRPHQVTPCVPQRSLSPEPCLEKPGPCCGAGLSSPRLGGSVPGFTPAHAFNPGGADFALFCSRVLGHCRESLLLAAGKSSPRSSRVLRSVSGASACPGPRPAPGCFFFSRFCPEDVPPQHSTHTLPLVGWLRSNY